MAEAEHADFEPLARRPDRFEISPRKPAQTKFERKARGRLRGDVGMGCKLIAHGHANEIGAGSIKPVTHEQVDPP